MTNMRMATVGGLLTHSFDDVVDQLLGLVDLVLGVCHDQTVQVLFLVASVSGIRATFALLDRALAANCDLGSRLSFHLFEGVATGSDK